MYDTPHGPAAPAVALAAHDMQILCDMDALAPLQPDWQRLWQADPEADLFLPWPWMTRVLARNTGRWRVYIPRDRASGQVRCNLPVHADDAASPYSSS